MISWALDADDRVGRPLGKGEGEWLGVFEMRNGEMCCCLDGGAHFYWYNCGVYGLDCSKKCEIYNSNAYSILAAQRNPH